MRQCLRSVYGRPARMTSGGARVLRVRGFGDSGPGACRGDGALLSSSELRAAIVARGGVVPASATDAELRELLLSAPVAAAQGVNPPSTRGKGVYLWSDEPPVPIKAAPTSAPDAKPRDLPPSSTAGVARSRDSDRPGARSHGVLLSTDELRAAVKGRGSVVPEAATDAELREMLLSSAVVQERHDPAYNLLSGAHVIPDSLVNDGRNGPGLLVKECVPCDTQIELGPMYGQASVTNGRAGRVMATAYVQWDQKVATNNVTVTLRDPPEAHSIIPTTFNRRIAPTGGEIFMGEVVRSVLACALDAAFPFQVHVTAQQVVSAAHPSIASFVMASAAAVRHAGVPMRTIGAARVAIVAGDDVGVVEPDESYLRTAQCVAEVIVCRDTGEILWINCEAPFASRATVLRCVRAAHRRAMDMGESTSRLLGCVPMRAPLFAHASLPEPVVAAPDFPVSGPSQVLLDTVSRLVMPIARDFASKPWPGVDASALVFERVMEQIASVIRERFTVMELRVATQIVWAEAMQAVARKTGLPKPTLRVFRDGSTPCVEVAHAGGASALSYIDFRAVDFRELKSAKGHASVRRCCHSLAPLVDVPPAVAAAVLASRVVDVSRLGGA